MGAKSSIIEAEDLDFASSPEHRGLGGPANLTLKELERHYIIQVLNEEGGHVDRAAKRLDIPRSTLYQKIKTYGPEMSRF
jgi:DNA-binding NtrC family response regulator